jgi:hypothetical protein
MEILNRFFENLAYKFGKEPKLSDITWALLSTSQYFQVNFLEYCFGKKISVVGDIEREYYRNGSIPDFYFTDINGGEYIIENKIFNHGDHFEQYKKEFPNATRAFIANYKEPEHDGWFIKTWKEFIIYFDNAINDKKIDIGKEEHDLINAYIVYLKSVTYFWEAKTMNFENLSSLSSFYGIISEIIEEFGFQNYNVASAINSMYYGQYFYFANKNKQNVYLWIGLYIPEYSGVYIKFQNFKDENWLPKTEWKKIENLTTGKYFDETSIEDGNYYIHLKDEYYEKLCDNVDVNIQKDIIRKFLEEIINIVK